MTNTSEPINPSSVLHRRPAYSLNEPALLCHRSYRFEDVSEDDSAELAILRRDNATIELNAALKRIQLAGRTKRTRAKICVFNLKSPRCETGCSVVAGGIAEVRATDIHQVDSQVTILAMLPIINGNEDGPWKGWRARMRVDLHSEFYSVTFILDRMAHDAVTFDGPSRIPTERRTAEQHAERWYHEIWAEFFDLFKAHEAKCDLPFDKFFECRGLILGVTPAAAVQAERPGHDPIIAPPRSRAQQRAARQALLDWPNMHAEFVRYVLHLDRAGRNEQDANCVLCTALDERVLYASSMGEADLDGESISPAVTKMPERYFLVHDGISRFQLGRLARRFHVLDELRCAAIFDFEKLIKASEWIRTLGNEIDLRLRTPERDRDAPSPLPSALTEIQAKLNELTAGPKSRADQKTIGGLLYRVNRSRYYARDFDQRITDMLFKRIEGWEPYDIFMHRNLYPIMDHIDSIGRRFDALAARVQRLTDASNVVELISVQKEIAHIQIIGEIIGWTAFAYYGGQILDKFLPQPETCALFNQQVLDVCHFADGHLGTLSLSIVALGAWLRFRNQRTGRARKRERGAT